MPSNESKPSGEFWKKAKDAIVRFFQNKVARWLVGVLGSAVTALVLAIFTPVFTWIEHTLLWGAIMVKPQDEASAALLAQHNIWIAVRDVNTKKDTLIAPETKIRLEPGSYQLIAHRLTDDREERLPARAYQFTVEGRQTSKVQIARWKTKEIGIKLLSVGFLRLDFSGHYDKSNLRLRIHKDRENVAVDSSVASGVIPLAQGNYVVKIFRWDAVVFEDRAMVTVNDTTNFPAIVFGAISGRVYSQSGENYFRSYEIEIGKHRVPIAEDGKFFIEGVLLDSAYPYKIYKSGQPHRTGIIFNVEKIVDLSILDSENDKIIL